MGTPISMGEQTAGIGSAPEEGRYSGRDIKKISLPDNAGVQLCVPWKVIERELIPAIYNGDGKRVTTWKKELLALRPLIKTGVFTPKGAWYIPLGDVDRALAFLYETNEDWAVKPARYSPSSSTLGANGGGNGKAAGLDGKKLQTPLEESDEDPIKARIDDPILAYFDEVEKRPLLSPVQEILYSRRKDALRRDLEMAVLSIEAAADVGIQLAQAVQKKVLHYPRILRKSRYLAEDSSDWVSNEQMRHLLPKYISMQKKPFGKKGHYP